MKKYLRPLKLGSLDLPINIAYSPLAGCSDLSFRRISRAFFRGLIFTEMVKMDALVRRDVGTMHILDYTYDLHPIGAQICGSKLSLVKSSARMIEDMGFDVIDLNCGCPVDKVTKDGSGSGLLQNISLIGDILNDMVTSVKIPVTVKIRVGTDDDSIVGPDVVKIAEEAGAKAIFVHGRTREQGYKGPANRNHIRDCKKAAKSILVFGNGDIFSPESALDMFETTESDGILVSRGTLGRPWIAKEIIEFLSDTSSSTDELKAFYDHYNLVRGYLNPKRSVLEMRKIGCWYLKGKENMAHLRDTINRSKTLQEIEEIMLKMDGELKNNSLERN